MHSSRRQQLGFTLIEMIIGIVLLAIALGSVLGLLLNQAPNAVDPAMQVRAAQLAQSISNQILLKAYDENSDHSGGGYRCGETGRSDCTAPANYGSDAGESNLALFDDVDDFHTKGNLINACRLVDSGAATNCNAPYPNFLVQIDVTAADRVTCPQAGCHGKMLQITITLPDGSKQAYALWRGNF